MNTLCSPVPPRRLEQGVEAGLQALHGGPWNPDYDDPNIVPLDKDFALVKDPDLFHKEYRIKWTPVDSIHTKVAYETPVVPGTSYAIKEYYEDGHTLITVVAPTKSFKHIVQAALYVIDMHTNVTNAVDLEAELGR